MASFDTLPYELKVQIAKDFIGMILIQAATITESDIVTGLLRVRHDYVPEVKLQIRAILEVEPGLGRDLTCYCIIQSRSEIAYREVQKQLFLVERVRSCARGLAAKLLTEDLEQLLSSWARVEA